MFWRPLTLRDRIGYAIGVVLAVIFLHAFLTVPSVAQVDPDEYSYDGY